MRKGGTSSVLVFEIQRLERKIRAVKNRISYENYIVFIRTLKDSHLPVIVLTSEARKSLIQYAFTPPPYMLSNHFTPN